MRSVLAGNRSKTKGIWWLAAGYFVFYIPYSGLTKALSSGLLERSGFVEGSRRSASGLEFLPAVLIGTVITLPLIFFCLGWYRYMGRRRVLGLEIFWPSGATVCSGFAFALIVVTTTLAYSFEGVSILFALLLMRGGVLIMSPVVDMAFSRPVQGCSWAGLGLSILAVSIALADVPEYTLSDWVLLNLCVYLTGYLFRLHLMTRCAKDVDEAVNRRFFVEESTVTIMLLMLVPGLIALLQTGEAGAALRFGFTSFLGSGLALPALMIGVVYGCLAMFGSLLYLNHRENTFMIPVNRCSSLMSGIVASVILHVGLGGDVAGASQLSGAVLIIVALAVLSLYGNRQPGTHGLNPLQRVFLFICDFNRARSPLAATICNVEIAKRLGLDIEPDPGSPIIASSAGLNLPADRELHPDAIAALKALGLPVPRHRASVVNSYAIHRAEKVLCMTSVQRQQLIARFPWAAGKIHSLDLEQGIHEPGSGGQEQLVAVALAIRRKISPLLNGSGFECLEH